MHACDLVTMKIYVSMFACLVIWIFFYLWRERANLEFKTLGKPKLDSFGLCGVYAILHIVFGFISLLKQG